jgi:hypothetical protein
MNKQDVTRRNFMIRTIIGIFVFIGTVLAAALGGFGIIPALTKRAPGWSDAGTVRLAKQEARWNSGRLFA